MNARRGHAAPASLPAWSPRAQRWLLLTLLAVNVAATCALAIQGPDAHIAAVAATAFALLLAALP